MTTNHRYLDVMTVRPSQGGLVRQQNSKLSHSLLLIEPILMPNLEHINIDVNKDASENCLFYPNGHKNRNIRREIENTVIKHQLNQNENHREKKRKNKYRIVTKDIYADAKGPPLYYSKKLDQETSQLIRAMKTTEGKIHSTVQIRV